MIAVFSLVMIGVAVRTYTTTPMYRATTSVLIEDDRAATVAGFNTTTSDSSYQDPEPYYQTQLRILTGRELASKAVVKLRLETLPEFNGQGPKRTGLASVLQTMKRQVGGACDPCPDGASRPRSRGKADRLMIWSMRSSEPSASIRCAAAGWSTCR